MPYVPDDNEAALLLDSVEGEQDASRKAVMVDLLGRYRDQKAAQGLKPFQPDQAAQRAGRERLEGMFDGLDKMDAGLDPAQKAAFSTAVDASTDKDEAKARMANQTWVLAQYPQLTGAVDADWTTVKHHVAKELFGNEAQAIPDTAFYAQIGGHIKKQRDERDMLADVLSKVQVEAAKGTGDWLAAWKKSASGMSTNAGYQPTNWDRYRQAAKKVFDETQQSIQTLRPAISAGQEYYRLATSGPATLPGKKDDQGNVVPKTRDEKATDWEQVVSARKAFLDELMRLPQGQREQALNLAIAGAADLAPKSMGAEGDASGIEKTTVSLERAIGNFPISVGRFILQGAQAASELTLQARNAYYGEQDTPQSSVYAEQAAMQRTDMSAAIDAGLVDAVDPIKSKSRLAQGVYDAMQSVPYMIAAGSQPEVGIPLTLAAMAEDNRRQFVANGVPAQEAATLALAAAVPQVAIERLQAHMLFHGKLPGAEKWLTKAVGSKLQLATKLLAVGGLETLHENAEEALQDITPMAYQELGSILSKDVPDVNWKQELAQYAGQRVDTFFALLPMVLVGTGTASFKEASYGRQYLSNKTMLKAAGFTEAAAEEISQTAVKGDVEKAQAMVQSGWEDPAMRPKAEIEKETAAAKADVESVGKMNSEEQQRAFDELDAEMKASYNEAANPSGARAIRNEDGTWTVVDGKDQYVDVTNSPEHAVDLVNEVNRADSANLTNVVDDMIDYFKQRGRGGEIVKTGDIRTVQDTVDEGQMSQDRATQLVNLYVELGVLPKGTTTQEARIYGESARVYNAKQKVFEYVSRLHDGADPLVLVEEEAEGYFKQALDSGLFSVEDVENWRGQVEGKPVQPKADKALRTREATEWFSRYAQAYITGKTQENAPVPLTFRRWLDKMKQVFADIFSLARDLIEKEKAGQLPDDFKRHLARAVGLDDTFIEDRMRQEERQAAAKSASGNWRAAEALQEIKLPTPRREASGMRGELMNLWESLKFDQRMKLFAAHDKSLDAVAELLREDYGFSQIMTGDDVVKLAEDTFLHGREITSDRNENTMAVRRGDQTGDLFGQKDMPFNLSGETAQDHTGAVDREEARRQAKKDQAKAQGSLFDKMGELPTMVSNEGASYAENQGVPEAERGEADREITFALRVAENAQLDLFGYESAGKPVADDDAAGSVSDEQREDLLKNDVRNALRDPTDAWKVGRAFGTGDRFSSIIPELIRDPSKGWDIRGAVIKSPRDLVPLVQMIRSPYAESVKVAFMNASGQVVHSAIMTIGSTTSALLSPATISLQLSRIAADFGALRVIVSHNHPSGDPAPSAADVHVTRQINQAIAMTKLELVDHIITNGETFYSFRENGMINSGESGKISRKKAKGVGADVALAKPIPALADWEIASRSELFQLNTAQKLKAVVDALATTNPEAAYVIYVNRKNRVLGVERVAGLDLGSPDGMREFKDRVFRGAGREAATSFLLSLPKGMNGGLAVKVVRQMREAGQAFDVDLMDANHSGNIESFRESGVLEQGEEYESKQLIDDRAEYDRLQAEMKKMGYDKAGTPEYNGLWQQAEDIKNRHGGFVPGDSSYALRRAPFYSRLTRTVEESQQAKATGEQWKAMIRNSKLGVSRGEYDLVGVDDLEGGKTYTKQEVLDYLRANEVQVKSVQFGDVQDADVIEAQQRLVAAGYQVDYEPGDEAAYVMRDGEDVAFDDLPDHLKADAEMVATGGRKPHFEDYTLPGAKEGSYREVLLTVPPDSKVLQPKTRPHYKILADLHQILARDMWRGLDNIRREVLGQELERKEQEEGSRAYYAIISHPKGEALYKEYIQALNDGKNMGVLWHDGHSQYDDVKNPIVRLRLNERTTADGKRMLFLEEVQAPQPEGFKRMPELFQKNWREIGFKWALRQAVEGGYDSIGWTTGDQQAERYDLSKQVRRITWGRSHKEDGPGYRLVSVEPMTGNDIEFKVKPDGTVTGVGMMAGNGAEGRNIGDVIGKEAAAKVMESEHGELVGQGLKIGGEGLRKLYDQDFRNVVNGLPAVKRAGQKATTAEISAGRQRKFVGEASLDDVMTKVADFRKAWSDPATRTPEGWRNWNVTLDNQASDVIKLMASGSSYADAMSNYGSEELAKKLGSGTFGAKDVGATVHSLTITPEMRDAIEGGQATFALRRQTETPEFKAWFGNSKVVDDQGKPLVVYHGTHSNKRIGRFRMPAYFSNSAEFAGRWVRTNEDHAVMYPVFLKIENPYVIDGHLEGRHFEWDAEDIKGFREDGYDGVVNKHEDGDIYVPFDQNQIKSATGNRGTFDRSNPDVTFSLKTAKNGDLIAVHNTSAEKLKLIDELGGLAVPSVAVIKHGTSEYDSFGDITLIAPKSLVDPKKSAKAKVFNTDIYSPRFPNTQFDVSMPNLRDAWKRLGDASKELGFALSSEVDHDEVQREGLLAFEKSSAVKAAFLKEEGQKPDLRNVPTETPKEFAQRFAGAKTRWELSDDPAFQKAALEHFREVYKDHADLLADITDEQGKLLAGTLDRFAGDVWQTNHPEVDRYRSGEAMSDQINSLGLRDKFEKWVQAKFGNVIKRKVIRDYNERTEKWATRPYDLDTVVSIMKRGLQDSEGFDYGVASIRANYARQFESLAEMKANAGSIVSDEEIKRLKEQTNEEFNQLANELAPYYRFDTKRFGYLDQVASAMKRLGKWNGEKLWSEDFKPVPADLMAKVRAFLTMLRDAPTEYFEAKVQRGVKLSEMAGAVIPSDTTEDVRDILSRAGVPMAEYKRGDQKARAEAVARFGDESWAVGTAKRAEDVQDAMRQRKIGIRVQDSPDFAQEVKDLVGRPEYAVRGMSVNEREAKKIIAEHDGNLAKLVQVLADPTQTLHPATKVALAFFVAESANKVGDFSTAAEVAKQAAMEATSLGQGVNELKRWSIFSQPETAQQLLQGEIEKENNRRKEREPAIKAVQDVYAEVQREARKLLRQWLDEINGVAGKDVSELEPVDVSSLPDVTFALRADIRESGIVQAVARMLKKSGAEATEKALVEKYGAGVEAHIPDILIEAQRSLMKRDGKEGKKFKTRIPVLSEDQIEHTLRSTRGKAEEQTTMPTVEELKAQGMSDDQVEETLRQFRNRQESQGELIPKPDQSGRMTPEQIDAAMQAAAQQGATGAQTFADMPELYDRLFEHLMMRIKEKVEGEQNIPVPRGIKEQIGEILNRHGLKATDDDVKRIIGARQLLPNMTPAQAEDLANYARRIASTPLGSFERGQQTMELFSYVHDQLAPYDLADVAFGLWYANVLSSLLTTARNVAGNASMLFLDQAAETLFRNPASYFPYLEQLAKATSESLEASTSQGKNTMKTGQEGLTRSLSVGDERRQGVLESKNAPLRTMRSISRVATRFLSVQDLFFANTAYEMKARQLAWDQARKEAATGKIKPEQIEERVSRLLNQATDQIQTFEDRAKVEWQNLTPEIRANYDEANWQRRRVKELQMFEREKQLVSRSLDFAQKVTLDYEPEGLMGLLLGGLSRVFTTAENAAAQVQNPKVKMLTKAAAKYGRTRVIPFMRVPVNVFNRALDYGPVGYGRALMDAAGIPVIQGMKTRVRSADERADLLKRATLGTMALLPLAILARPPSPDDEPEEYPWLQIHGAGSGNPNTNIALNGPKYRPYSLELRVGDKQTFIDYRMFPLAPYLAAIGSLHDRTRYKKAMDDKSALVQGWIIAQAMKESFMSSSPITSLRELSEAAAENQPMSERSVNRTLARGSVGVVSNLIPLSGLWRSLDQLAGGDRNTRDTLLAASMAEIPVAGRMNLPSVDVLGDNMSSRAGIGWLADWSKMETPESRIYAAFAEKDVTPTDISRYQHAAVLRQDDGTKRALTEEEFYEFAKARGKLLKETLLSKNEEGQTGLEHLLSLSDKAKAKDEDSPAKKYLARISRSATRRALIQVGLKTDPETPAP